VTDQESLARFRHELQALSAGSRLEPGPDCLDPETVAAVADGALDGKTRERALDHLARCAHCQAAIASLARALGDPVVARETGRSELSRWSRLPRIAIPLAAAAMLLVLVWPRQRHDDGESEPRHRAPTITAAPEPAAMWPLGTVKAAGFLRWGTVPGADLYRVILFDAEGRVLYESQLADTVAALPDSITLIAGPRYLWKVEARTGWDRWSASRLVEFSLAPDKIR
jgi:hypothetical protein